MTKVRQTVEELYEGGSRVSVWFRYGLILFDFATITYFVITAPMQNTATTNLIDTVIAILIALDLFCRLWIAPDRWALMRRAFVIADVIVIGAVIAQFFLPVDLAFLRILRALRLVHSYHLLADLRRWVPAFRRNEDTVIASVNLLVFVFFTTSVVFALSFKRGDGAASYIDALYFTISTLTTTGYGDITPTTSWGKLTAVAIMIVGVTLFVNLARAILSPNKVRVTCESCGLERHDADAVHCKHCGATIHIPNEG